jgi:hypothetical protein
MMTRRAFGLGASWLFAGGAGAVLAGCAGRTKALRYRVTLEVDTPSGLRTGSSVLESTFTSGSRFEYSARAWTYGEAPTVDLGNGRYLFAVLSDPFGTKTMYQMLLHVLRYPETRPPLADPDASSFRQANETKPFGVVRRDDYPMLVTFGNVNDPATVMAVNPENMASEIGAGHDLRRITIQVVSKDVSLTNGFENRFPKIANQTSPFRERLAGLLRTDDPAGRLQNGYFVWRTCCGKAAA